MKKNVGTLDKLIRIIVVIGIAALLYFKVLTGLLAIIAVIVGLCLLVTIFTSWCCIWALLRVNTRKHEEHQEPPKQQ